MKFRTTVPPVALLPATLQHLEAFERDRDEFGRLIGSPVPDGWPQFPESIGFTRERLAAHPEEAGWWMFFFLEPESGTLLGSGGFAGPPRDRVVEFGYEIAPEFRGRRFGVGAAAAMLHRAAESGEVDAVTAHTLPEENPSTRVLATLDFERDGESTDPDEGTVWRWRRALG